VIWYKYHDIFALPFEEYYTDVQSLFICSSDLCHCPYGSTSYDLKFLCQSPMFEFGLCPFTSSMLTYV